MNTVLQEVTIEIEYGVLQRAKRQKRVSVAPSLDSKTSRWVACQLMYYGSSASVRPLAVAALVIGLGSPFSEGGVSKWRAAAESAPAIGGWDTQAHGEPSLEQEKKPAERFGTQLQVVAAECLCEPEKYIRALGRG